MPKRITIGFIPLYDVHYASSRYRIFQYRTRLQQLGFGCYHLPAPLMNNLKRLIYLPRLIGLSRSCDILYIQKRIFPAWIIQLITRLNDRILYDFDDAIYLKDSQKEQFRYVIKKSRLVVAGNEYLLKYARQFNQSIVEIPTVVDTDYYRPTQGERHSGDPRVLLGWIGFDPNRGDLDLIAGSLEKIGNSFPQQVAILVIGRHSYKRKISIPQIFIPWTLQTSLKALQKIDIGIMPLENSEWNKGKCAFKLIQYASIQAACIASPIGMNSKVILPGATGYLADTQEEWYDKLALLIQDTDLRIRLGQNGRTHIVQHYSIAAWLPKLVAAIEYVARS